MPSTPLVACRADPCRPLLGIPGAAAFHPAGPKLFETDHVEGVATREGPFLNLWLLSLVLVDRTLTQATDLQHPRLIRRLDPWIRLAGGREVPCQLKSSWSGLVRVGRLEPDVAFNW